MFTAGLKGWQIASSRYPDTQQISRDRLLFLSGFLCCLAANACNYEGVTSLIPVAIITITKNQNIRRFPFLMANFAPT